MGECAHGEVLDIMGRIGDAVRKKKREGGSIVPVGQLRQGEAGGLQDSAGRVRDAEKEGAVEGQRYKWIWFGFFPFFLEVLLYFICPFSYKYIMYFEQPPHIPPMSPIFLLIPPISPLDHFASTLMSSEHTQFVCICIKTKNQK